MINLSLLQKIMILVAALGAALIFIFQRGLYTFAQPNQEPILEEAGQEAKIVSTNPSPLEKATILPSQAVEITFNYPLANSAEFKHKLEPEVAYEVKLSEDRKTVRLIPQKTFELGTSYTLFITCSETKFENNKKLPADYIYHFKTIDYKGI